MPIGKRVIIIAVAAGLTVGLVAAAVAWRARSELPWLALRAPVLTLPDPNQVLHPGANGRPMLLVVIENSPEARPQSGVSDACLVYAVPTEARITRFLTAYCARTPGIIGPVRSARRYMLEIAGDLGAILVHVGYSPEAQAMIARQRLPVINEFSTPEPFWRDGQRSMPHNLYTGFDRLRQAAARKGIVSEPKPLPFVFSYEGPEAVPAEPASVVTLDYGPLYAATYRYDTGLQRYLREQDGRPHLDANGRQVTAASVLVAFVAWRDVWVNGRPSSQIDLIGEGRLAIITEGRMVEGRWSRPEGRPLAFTGPGDRPVALPPGPVWIELLPADRRFSIQSDAFR